MVWASKAHDPSAGCLVVQAPRVSGLCADAERMQPTAGASLQLALYLIRGNLAAQVGIQTRAILPRTWLENRKARRSLIPNALFRALLLLLAPGILVWIWSQGSG